MYIFEFIIKKFTRKKNDDTDFEQNILNNSVETDYENCEHLFMPIDSTNEILACAKCGLIRRKDELKKKNFFEQ